MNIKKLPRSEREKLYIKKQTELQRIWQNPIDDDWNFLKDKEWTDEVLNKQLEDTIGQIRFEKGLKFIGLIFKIVVIGFVVLGLIGLLVFGIKQLF